ncbi:MAG: glycosyltransferase [Clostridia bacterium]|nr:glycosyltransferase [Clostridia bacterium]
MLKNNYTDIKILYSKKKNYYLRIAEVNLKLLFERKSKYDIIFFGFLPQLIFSFFYKKKKENQLIIIDFIISLYNTLIFDRKRIKEKALLARLLKNIDTKISSKADIVYTDTKTQARYFEKEFNIDKSKFQTLYLEPNTDIYNKNTGYIKLKDSDDEFIVLWFGTILPLQGVDIILESAKLLNGNKKIKFYIIGNIKNLNVDEKEYMNVKFIPWMLDKELAKYINSADLCLAGHFSSKNERANREIPGKAFTYKAMGKKIILGKSEANQEKFIENNRDIFYVERGNPEKLAKKIEEVWVKSKEE